MAFQIVSVPENLGDRIRTVSGSVTTPLVEYPSTWFGAHENQKVSIDFYQNTTAGQAYSIISNYRQNGRWDDVLIATFLKTVMEEQAEWLSSSPLTEAWVVNGVQIGGVGDTVHPQDLATWSPKARPADMAPIPNQEGEDLSRRSAFLALISIYRKVLAREINAEYGGLTATRITENYKKQPLGMNQADVGNFQNYETTDRLSLNYRKILAIIDMFFNKFQNHDKSMIRMGTLPTRYRGCATLTSYGEISIRLGVEPAHLSTLILTNSVAKDFDKINRAGEQAEDINGYFPYQVELDIVKKCAYAANNCPALYLWLHTIGVMLQQPRSVKAQVPRNVPDQMGTINSAIAVSMQFISGGQFSIQFVGSVAVRDAVREMEDAQMRLHELQAAAGAENEEEQEDPENRENEEDDDDNASDNGEEQVAPQQPVVNQREIDIAALQTNIQNLRELISRQSTLAETCARRALNYLRENNGLSQADKREVALRFRAHAGEAEGRVGKLLSTLFPTNR